MRRTEARDTEHSFERFHYDFVSHSGGKVDTAGGDADVVFLCTGLCLDVIDELPDKDVPVVAFQGDFVVAYEYWLLHVRCVTISLSVFVVVFISSSVVWRENEMRMLASMISFG